MFSGIRKHFTAFATGLRQLLVPRMTVRYPDVVLQLPQTNFAYDPKKSVASPGWKGRHILYFDKCTGCNLCSIACENIAEAIVMMPIPQEKRAQNMKSIWPAVDYGRCVFCGFCIDACPFYALEMGSEVELAELDRSHLFYTPHELAQPVKKPGKPLVSPAFDERGVSHR